MVTGTLYTLESMGTFGGATGATVVIANAIQYLTNRNPRWLALFISQAVCAAGLMLSSSVGLEQIVVSFVNGFLVFGAATGVAQIPSSVANEKGKRQTVDPVNLDQGKGTGRFLSGRSRDGKDQSGHYWDEALARRRFWDSWF